MVGGVLVGVTVNSFKPNHKKIVLVLVQPVSVISIPGVRRVGSTTSNHVGTHEEWGLYTNSFFRPHVIIIIIWSICQCHPHPHNATYYKVWGLVIPPEQSTLEWRIHPYSRESIQITLSTTANQGHHESHQGCKQMTPNCWTVQYKYDKIEAEWIKIVDGTSFTGRAKLVTVSLLKPNFSFFCTGQLQPVWRRRSQQSWSY